MGRPLMHVALGAATGVVHGLARRERLELPLVAARVREHELLIVAVVTAPLMKLAAVGLGVGRHIDALATVGSAESYDLTRPFGFEILLRCADAFFVVSAS